MSANTWIRTILFAACVCAAATYHLIHSRELLLLGSFPDLLYGPPEHREYSISLAIFTMLGLFVLLLPRAFSKVTEHLRPSWKTRILLSLVPVGPFLVWWLVLSEYRWSALGASDYSAAQAIAHRLDIFVYGLMACWLALVFLLPLRHSVVRAAAESRPNADQGPTAKFPA